MDLLASLFAELMRGVLQTAPIWLSIFLIIALRGFWYMYRRYEFRTKIKWLLLEIRLPREILKSPRAMEAVLAAFHMPSAGDAWSIMWKGGQMHWSSLEICSFGGNVRFFVRINKVFRNVIESQIYAQYPDVEISEVDDYVNDIPYEYPNCPWHIWGMEVKFAKPDAYPILTYKDYGLEKDPKEEFKHDPMSPIIEFLGMINPDEQIWIQIPIQPATKDRYHAPGTWFQKVDWKKDAEALIKKLSKRDKFVEGSFNPESMLTPGERTILERVEDHLGKLAFDCGIRIIYWSKKGQFSVPNVHGILGMFRAFNSTAGNAFKFGFATTYDEPWRDPTGIRSAWMRDAFWNAYRERGFFYWPYHRKPMVLSVEELASLYHFPGKVVSTPTLERIESKKAEAPANLPL